MKITRAKIRDGWQAMCKPVGSPPSYPGSAAFGNAIAVQADAHMIDIVSGSAMFLLHLKNPVHHGVGVAAGRIRLDADPPRFPD